ncbi:hypothetical protein [Thalassovita sp.]|uniref:hypothetical protein n=1 Tax=Thalassovita sp. TaxID=1979401 RepID=UPI003B5B1499
MTIETAAPTVHTALLFLSIIKSRLNRRAISTHSDTAYSDAVARARDEVSVAGKKHLSGASRKRLENALSDFSGI